MHKTHLSNSCVFGVNGSREGSEVGQFQEVFRERSRSGLHDLAEPKVHSMQGGGNEGGEWDQLHQCPPQLQDKTRNGEHNSHRERESDLLDQNLFTRLLIHIRIKYCILYGSNNSMHSQNQCKNNLTLHSNPMSACSDSKRMR